MIRSRFLETVKRHSMLVPGDRICVAFSGGPDSTALLELLSSLKGELDIELSACHINHGLRGKESDDDAGFVAGLCGRLSIPFRVTTVDVKKYRSLTGGSIQTAARDLRYLVFKRIIRIGAADKIATAHTADDDTETVLINFLRGSGPQGLIGIPAVREGLFIRPFIDIGKTEILEFLKRAGIPYREDSSNADVKYLRNAVRKTLVPVIKKEFNPGIRGTLRRSAEMFYDIQSYLIKKAEVLVNKISVPTRDGRGLIIDCPMFMSIDRALQREIIKTVVNRVRKGGAPLNFEHVENLRILACGKKQAGELSLPGVTASVSHGKYYLNRHQYSRTQKFSYHWQSALPIVIKELNCKVKMEKVKPPHDLMGNGNSVYLDGDSVPADAQFRNRNDGDRFHPLGASGTQKLKQYFIDKKIPRWERDSVLLLASGSNVLWVAGYRLSEEVRVGEDSKNVLKLQLEYNR
ncbi:MAG: tRNA lysidine(34) synthetase TilS [Nitrospinota bacterium]